MTFKKSVTRSPRSNVILKPISDNTLNTCFLVLSYITCFARSMTPNPSSFYKPQLLKTFPNLQRMHNPTRLQISAPWKLPIGKSIVFFFRAFLSENKRNHNHGILSKSTRVQNPPYQNQPAFKIHPFFFFIY